MSWTADRLPISLPPLAGEGLDSWIEAYALRLRTTARELLNFLSLPRARPGQMVIALTDSERDTLADATGVDGDRLTGMTLHLDDGVSVMIRTRTRGLARPRPGAAPPEAASVPDACNTRPVAGSCRGACPGHSPAHAMPCSCGTPARPAR